MQSGNGSKVGCTTQHTQSRARRPSIVALISNPSTGEAKAGASKFKASWSHTVRLVSPKTKQEEIKTQFIREFYQKKKNLGTIFIITILVKLFYSI